MCKTDAVGGGGKSSEFTCARCGGTFEKGWDDEEALAEMELNFGDLSQEELAVLCDECYAKFMRWFRSEPAALSDQHGAEAAGSDKPKKDLR